MFFSGVVKIRTRVLTQQNVGVLSFRNFLELECEETSEIVQLGGELTMNHHGNGPTHTAESQQSEERLSHFGPTHP